MSLVDLEKAFNCFPWVILLGFFLGLWGVGPPNV